MAQLSDSSMPPSWISSNCKTEQQGQLGIVGDGGVAEMVNMEGFAGSIRGR